MDQPPSDRYLYIFLDEAGNFDFSTKGTPFFLLGCITIYHHDSKSNFDLQIADYFNWAVYRKWDRNDTRSYDLIRSVVKSEFAIFRTGRTYYFG